MSNQCSNVFNHRSLFNPFHTPLKPYRTALHPIFPFHSNLILFSRRSRPGRSSSPHPLSAQSSPGIVLIATTEHRDGSLVFRFGDACEVVENDKVVDEIETQFERESNYVEVLDGNQELQVIQKTIEGGYGSEGGRFTELADGIGNEDIGSKVTKRETNVVCDVRDYHAESIEKLSDISEDEVLSSQSDTDMNNYLEGVQTTLDKSECASQCDGDESLNRTIFLLDDSSNTDKSVDETEDPLVSVELESMQVSHIEFMDGKQRYAMDELHKLETEDASKSNTKDLVPPATMHISDVELVDAANEDVEEELQDININVGTLIDALIDEMPPSNRSGAEPTLDEVSQPQPIHVKVEATMEVSSTKAEDVKYQATEDELQQMSTGNRDENDVACLTADSRIKEEVIQPQSAPVQLKTTMQVSDIELDDAMGQNVDDEIIQIIGETDDPPVSVKIETMQGSHTEVMDVTQPYAEEELLKVETEDTSDSDMEDLIPPYAANEDVEEELQDININKGTLRDETPPSYPLEAEPTLDEVSEPQSIHVKLEATMEVSSTEADDDKDHATEDELQQMSTDSRDENDVACLMADSWIEDAEPILQEEVNKPQSASVQLKTTEDTMGQNEDDEIPQVINVTEDPLVSVNIETMQVSHNKVMDVSEPYGEDELHKAESNNLSDTEDLTPPATMFISDVELTDAANMDLEEGLQDMNINEGTLIDGIPPSDSLSAEPSFNEVSELQPIPVKVEATIEVSSTNAVDIEDRAIEDDLQQGSTDNMDKKDVAFVMPISCTEEAEPILEDEGVNHNILEQCAETDALGSSILVKQGLIGSLLEEETIEGKVNGSELAEASENSVLLSEAEAKVKRDEIYLTSYFLSSGATSLEHPFKVEMMPILLLAANG